MGHKIIVKNQLLCYHGLYIEYFNSADEKEICHASQIRLPTNFDFEVDHTIIIKHNIIR